MSRFRDYYMFLMSISIAVIVSNSLHGFNTYQCDKIKKLDKELRDQPYALENFNFHEVNKLVEDEIRDPEALSVPGLIRRALEYGLESQHNMQELYVARKEVIREFGHIFPQLNVLATLESAGNRHVSVEAVLPLVGFIFPNRWFSIFAARSGRKATEESIETAFADTVQEIEHLYYEIQLQQWSLRVMDFYLKEYEQVIEFIKNKIATGSNRFTPEHLSVFKIHYNELIHKRAFMDSLAAALPHMATILGFDPRVDWASLKIQPTIIDFEDQPIRQYDEFYPKAEINSSEIRALGYLIKAAKRTLRANYFTFLDPHSGRDFGIHYLTHLKIAHSKVSSLKIEIKMQKNNISNNLQHALNQYSESTKSTRVLRGSLGELENLRSEAQKQLTDESTPFEIVTVTRYFEEAKKQALNFIYSYFVYHTAVADFNRYTREGEYYQIVRDYRDKIPVFIKNVRREHSFRHRAIKSIKSITRN